MLRIHLYQIILLKKQYFSALENTRASILQAFRGISAGNITGEQLDNIEEQLFLADIGYDTVEN